MSHHFCRLNNSNLMKGTSKRNVHQTITKIELSTQQQRTPRPSYANNLLCEMHEYAKY